MGGSEDDLIETSLEEEDLYDVTTWEERTRIDKAAVFIYRGLTDNWRRMFVALAVLLFVAQLAATGFILFLQPALGVLTLLSVIPAFVLAAIIWYGDEVQREPLAPLAITFLLGVLFAGFAALLNTTLQPVFELIPVVGTVAFFYVVVGPVEETSKWLASRLYAYRTPYLGAAIDGAVFGAFAGLGFATIENFTYITNALFAAGRLPMSRLASIAIGTAAQRSFVGPGHVIYASFAGYYLGLAKGNPENRGPIVVKGLLIAVLIHATYDTLVTYLPFPGLTFIAFVVVYDGFFLFLLYRKIAAYRHKYEQAMEQPERTPS
ncbi:PrsW family glutamic-type intramembrane protease [Haladaptatus sp. DYF46]|uniref:PrsW family intramembrane metalloprotease n=1 Tax=Haladaptatus sp. DYF46 TaxID=2886041 RepID=UPI001E376E8B|nr:PrsW family glutamic-type intramembrane protease [Haladaptatus sp. DYF46]